MKHKPFRAALGLSVVAASIWLLIGCIMIPLPNMPQDGTRNAATEVGGAKSNRALRATKSTRDEVVAHLGEPWFTSADRRLVGYRWTAATAHVGTCSAGELLTDDFVPLLHFDENDILKTFRIRRDRPALRSEVDSLLPTGKTLQPELKEL